MQQERQAAGEVVKGLPTTSAKIRALAQAGYDRTEISEFLRIRYQHVRKVLIDAGITNGLRRPLQANPKAIPRNASSLRNGSSALVPVPSAVEFRRGYLTFRDKERRDAMYKTATFLVKYFWGKAAEIADGLGVLLLTWNQAHYRYGSFDFQLLEKVVTANQQQLDSFRNRDIFSYVPADDPAITSLFGQLLDALRICEGKKKGAKSPVAVAKALHLLGPAYFPLWDFEIAKAFGCSYGQQPAAQYLAFVRKTKYLAEQLTAQGIALGDTDRTSLKVLDEYNYARYTKHWV